MTIRPYHPAPGRGSVNGPIGVGSAYSQAYRAAWRAGMSPDRCRHYARLRAYEGDRAIDAWRFAASRDGWVA